MPEVVNESREICPGIILEGNCLRVDLSLYFSNSDAVPADVFADSVQGMSRMVKETQAAFARMLGIEGQRKMSVYIDTVRNGSKISDFMFRVFFGSDEEANRTADKLHERFGVNGMIVGNKVAAIAIAGIIAFLLRDIARTYMTADNVQPAVEATNSIIMSAGRDLNITQADLERIIGESVSCRRRAAKDAVLAVQPAMMRTNTLVKIGGRDGIEIPQTVVAHLPPPSAIDTKEPPQTVTLADVRMEVLAIDIERRKTGWAVKLPVDTIGGGKRLRAVIDDSIEPSDIAYRHFVLADISLYLTPDGRPDHVLVRAVRNEE